LPHINQEDKLVTFKSVYPGIRIDLITISFYGKGNHTKNQEKETVMEQEIHITLRFDLAIGKVNLNEIVYRLNELQNPLMLEILISILMGYDDIISDRLSLETKTRDQRLF